MEEPFEIRSKSITSIFMLLCGLASIAVMFIHTFSIFTLVGILLVIAGILTLINPMAEITEDEIRIKNPLGMTMKVFPLSDVEVRNDGLYIEGKLKYSQLTMGTRLEDVETFIKQMRKKK